MQYIITFFNSSFFVAFVTLAVGGLAIWLYIQQKRDRKRDASGVILAEIRYAESLIDKFKSSGVSNDITYRLLYDDNWSKYNHLFIGDLDQDEIAEINNFYNQCFILDKTLNQINVFHELKNKSQAVHQTLSLIAKESLGNKETFEINRKNYLELIEKDPYIFRADAPVQSLLKTINNVRFVTTSTAGAKLKQIAGLK